MYAKKMDHCDAESFDNKTIVACQSFVYDQSLFPETLTTKLDLVRNFNIKALFSQMSQNIDLYAGL